MDRAPPSMPRLPRGSQHTKSLFCHPELLLVSPIFKGRRREWRNNITIGSQFVSPPPDALEPLPRRFAHRSPQRFPQNKGPRLLLPVLGGTDKINCAQRAGAGESVFDWSELFVVSVQCRHLSELPIRYCALYSTRGHTLGVPPLFGRRKARKNATAGYSRNADKISFCNLSCFMSST